MALAERAPFPRIVRDPRLTESDVQKALAFYRVHAVEIDARIEAQLCLAN